MRDLLKWQSVSFVSRGFAMALGIVQSIVIVRILSVSEYGLVSIVVSIGSAFGIYQNLGLASGGTREISAAADDKPEIFKIFTTSVLIRYLITIPLAAALFLLAETIAIGQYSNPSLIFPLKIFSAVLLVQGFQSLFNSVISGTQRFKRLFIYQVAIAFVSVLIYIPMIYFYKVNGYFYALFLFNIVASLVLGVLALYPLKGNFAFPSKMELKRLMKELLSLSLGIYAVKIIYTYWNKSGPILLGLTVTPEEVGIYSFALLYAGKLMAVSDAATDVSLPVLSKKFVENIKEFKELFSANFNKIYVFLMFAAGSAVFWSREVITLLVGGGKYEASFPFILPLTFAMAFYALINIIKSGVIVPAKMIKEMIFSFVLMLFGTVMFYYFSTGLFGNLQAMSYGMVFGAVLAFLALILFISRSLNFSFFGIFQMFLLIFSFGLTLLSSMMFVEKLAIYVIYAFVYLFVSKNLWAKSR